MMKGYNIKDCITGADVHRKYLTEVADFLGWGYSAIAYHYQARKKQSSKEKKEAKTDKVFRSKKDLKYYLVQKITV